MADFNGAFANAPYGSEAVPFPDSGWRAEQRRSDLRFLQAGTSVGNPRLQKMVRGVRERPVSIFRRPWSSSGFRRRPSACMRVISVEDSRDHGQGPLRGWWILTGRSRTPPTVPRRCRFPIPVVSGAASIDFEVAASGNPSSAIHDCKNGRGRSREPPR